ncbi:MAG: choice-of-anchor Q domain-containing protein, partial [Candidatus Methanofastidiosa archaeon]|nr:choice-of-anchor Q domain-containing protein [Candidatus Methanofastidiosa archaeon]
CDSTYDEPDNNAVTTITYSNVGGGYPGEGNIDADPQFVNAPTDLSLQSTSPCVDAGTNTNWWQYGYVTDDILGVARPQRSAYDMGAYECTGKSSFSPVIIQPLARTQLASVLSLWEDLLNRLPDEPTDEMAALIEQTQGHVANAAQLTNPIYASGQLSKAAAAMQQLAALLA